MGAVPSSRRQKIEELTADIKGNAVSRTKALKDLMRLSATRENLVEMGSKDLGLLLQLARVLWVHDHPHTGVVGIAGTPYLNESDRVQFHSSIDDRVRALTILRNISTVEGNREHMASPKVGLLNGLKDDIILGHNRNTRRFKPAVLFALEILFNLSSSPTSGKRMIASDPMPMLTMFKKVLIEHEYKGEGVMLVLKTVLNLLSWEHVGEAVISSTLGMLSVLISAAVVIGGDGGQHVLRIFSSLSTAGHDISLLASDIRALTFLKEFVVGHVDLADLAALTILLNLAGCDTMTDSIYGLFNVLTKVVSAFEGRPMLSALRAVLSLVDGEVNSIEPELLAILIDAVSVSEAPMIVLNLIHKIAKNPHTCSLLRSTNYLLYPALSQVVLESDTESTNLALHILLTLESTTKTAIVDEAAVSLLPTLINTMTIDTEKNQLVALRVLSHLSAFPAMKGILVDATVSLFPDLIAAVVGRLIAEHNLSQAPGAAVDRDPTRLCLEIISSLSSSVEVCAVLATSHVTVLFPALKDGLSNSIAPLLCIRTIQNLCDKFPDCWGALSSPDLGLVQVLVRLILDKVICGSTALLVLHTLAVHSAVAVDTIDCALIPVLKGIDRDVSWIDADVDQLQVKMAAAGLRLLMQYGLTLELTLMCGMYCSNKEKERIKQAKLKYVGITEFNELLTKSSSEFITSLKGEVGVLLALNVAVNPTFQVLLAKYTKEQANWLRRELSAYSQIVIHSRNDLLGAFHALYIALPEELHDSFQPSPVTPSHEVAFIEYAEITDEVVRLNKDRATVVDGMFYRRRSVIPVKIKLKRLKYLSAVQQEYFLLQDFHNRAAAVVVTPFALVQVSDGTLLKPRETLVVGGHLSQWIGIVLERGSFTMAHHLTTSAGKEPANRPAMLSAVVKIIEAAHHDASKAKLVLMDFKPANIVYCPDTCGVGCWKAIDFDTSLYAGDVVVSRAGTPHYSSRELAQHMLSNTPKATLKAHTAMDIASLGWTAWEIFNGGKSLWDTLDISNNPNRILSVLSQMTQPVMEKHIHDAFGDTNPPLCRFLCKLLHVDPEHRPHAGELRNTSLLCEKPPTLQDSRNISFDELLRVVRTAIDNGIDHMQSVFENRFDISDQKYDAMAEEVRSKWTRFDTALQDEIFAQTVRDKNLDETVSHLTHVVSIISQQRNLSWTEMSSLLESHTGDVTRNLMPHIKAVMDEIHDESMSENMKLDKISMTLASMQIQLSDVLNLQRTQLSIMIHLESGGHRFPSTFILVPQRSTTDPSQGTGGGISRRIAMAARTTYAALVDKLFSTLYLFFFCPVTGKLVPCGNGGEGYVLTSLRKWVRQLIPIVKMGLLAAKVLLATQGLGSLIPGFPTNLTYVDALITEVATIKVDEMSDKMNEIEEMSFEKELLSSLSPDMLQAIMAQVAVQDGTTVAEVKADGPKYCGLEWVPYVKPGEEFAGAWVSPEGKADFKLKGPAAFK